MRNIIHENRIIANKTGNNGYFPMDLIVGKSYVARAVFVKLNLIKYAIQEATP